MGAAGGYASRPEETPMRHEPAPRRLIPLLSMVVATGLFACAGDKGEGADGPVDADGDGYTSDVDCDDTNPEVYPSDDVAEACDGLDNDCDGLTDLEDPEVEGWSTWFIDSDEDGYGDPGLTTDACTQPEASSTNGDDCDDRDNRVYPGATELCDGVDNDCDTLVDTDDDEVTGISTWGPDADGDHWGDLTQAVRSCEEITEEGWVENALDCDDTDDTIHPEADETCGDDIDSDCDGSDSPPGFRDDSEVGCARASWEGGEAEGLGVSIVGGLDVNGDNQPDLVLGSEADAAWVVTELPVGAVTVADGAAVLRGEAGSGFGAALWLGDARGDAAAELLVGAAGEDAAYLYEGSGLSSLGLTFTGEGDFGAAVVISPDLNGDGEPDLLFGAPALDGTGAVYVGLSPLSSTTFSRGDAFTVSSESGLGSAVASVGDMDGDGASDTLIGAPDLDGVYGGVGAVWSCVGEASAGALGSCQRYGGEAEGDAAGSAVAAAGDMNDDGYADAIVGAPGSDEGDDDAGRIYILFGPPIVSDTLADAGVVGDGGRAFGAAGTAVGGAGDFNYDGYSDVLIGQPTTDGGAGTVHVLYGPVVGSVPLDSVCFQIEGEVDDGLGRALAPAGDINDDFRADWLLGAPSAESGAGAAYLFLGSSF